MSSFDEENNTQVDYWQVLRNHWMIILITLIMCVVTAFVITTLIKPTYASTTTFEVNPDSFTTKEAAAEGAYAGGSRNFLETQRLAIVSAETLKIADGWVKEEDSEQGYSKRLFTKGYGDDYDAALQILANKISVEVQRGSDMFSVTAYDNEKKQAQRLAEEVRNAYLKRRLASRERLATNTGGQLRQDYKDAKENVKITFEKLKKSSAESDFSLVLIEVSDLNNEAKKEYVEQTTILRNQQDEIKRFEALATNINDKTDAELISYLTISGSIIQNVTVPQLHDEIQELKAAKEIELIKGIGVNHPTIASIDKSIQTKTEELSLQLTSVRQEIKNSLSDQLAQKEITEASVNELKRNFSEHTDKFNKHSLLIEEYNQAKADLIRIEQRTKSLQSSTDFYNEPIVLQTKARLPKKQVSPDVPLIMGVGTAAGLIFGLAIAFLIELLDTSVKRMEDVEKYLQVPVLAVVPQDVGLLHELGGSTPDAEAYRILRTNIEFNRKDESNNAITVVSGGAGEGKSTTLLNLAYICAQGGYTTLLIDADLRRPRIHTYLGVENKVGLSNYLTTDAPLENVVVKTKTDNLFFMSAGVTPQDAAGILNSKRMTEMISDVKSRFDLVLVDSPPILGVSDASVISSEVDHTIIVIQHRKLPRKLLMRVKQAVENVGGNIIGVVLNNVDVRSDTEYQYYTSYYTYYSPAAMKDAEQAAAQQKKATPQGNGDELY